MSLPATSREPSGRDSSDESTGIRSGNQRQLWSDGHWRRSLSWAVAVIIAYLLRDFLLIGVHRSSDHFGEGIWLNWRSRIPQPPSVYDSIYSRLSLIGGMLPTQMAKQTSFSKCGKRPNHLPVAIRRRRKRLGSWISNCRCDIDRSAAEQWAVHWVKCEPLEGKQNSLFTHIVIQDRLNAYEYQEPFK
ncbi:hypothetical protein TBK1r_48490 [Stieleria magnilauensis]|uniref:Uncharacterized protein n=1 Tax=Stieleria magnilauensis TaxID=2527963 RepID=A0ABX5XUY0_9BACT|nr:hypothetical protein TBK1r_48490 [Planctomycetes bacterium TBK1r]